MSQIDIERNIQQSMGMNGDGGDSKGGKKGEEDPDNISNHDIGAGEVEEKHHDPNMLTDEGENDISSSDGVKPKKAGDEEQGGDDEDEDEEEKDVFGDVGDGNGPDFRGVSTLGAAVLFAKAQFGLGVLGIPQTFQVLGFVPGLISLCILCALATYMAVIVGNFRLSHPHVHSIGDAAYMLFGSFGRELLGITCWLFYTLSYGSGLITLSEGFNSFNGHDLCQVMWVGVGAIITLVLGVTIRTMKVLSWGGYVAVVTIFFGVWIVGIACLVERNHPPAAPDSGPINKGVVAVKTGSKYYEIAAAVSSQLFALCGTASFFTVHAEMKHQEKFLTSLLIGQGFIIFNYVALACVVYGAVGQYVAAPVLGTAGPLIMKIAYAVALPSLIFSAVLQAHVSGKYAMVRILRGTKHLQANTLVHWMTWISMMLIVIVVGFVMAGAVPFFNDLTSLTGALFGTSFTLIVPGFMGLYEMANHNMVGKPSKNPIKWLKQSREAWFKTRKSTLITFVCWFAVCAGTYITISGVYGSVSSIANGYSTGAIGSSFSCKYTTA